MPRPPSAVVAVNQRHLTTLSGSASAVRAGLWDRYCAGFGADSPEEADAVMLPPPSRACRRARAVPLAAQRLGSFCETDLDGPRGSGCRKVR
jgi:hypothetical protein